MFPIPIPSASHVFASWRHVLMRAAVVKETIRRRISAGRSVIFPYSEEVSPSLRDGRAATSWLMLGVFDGEGGS